ncbi:MULTISPECIES: DNA-3-methyladenine glycosylase I [Clostridium]|jgi:DNA-3-methyladenine glycosylase I|uniref:DNA-3-methyladenine glycosylase I n=2 Tax=Clostridium perfringens TaxID=1502 RepID=A0AAW9J5N4_CLOPF|nr:DNA-3-methyladenine glycosylase I [Clostridium perfringens]MDZ5034073.1 DNA-3-methyladenine glycosylase I [Clostridium perfringens]
MKEHDCIRCDWANHNPLEKIYHDKEWGNPVYDDKKLFEMLILEGKQAGLSWSTILAKRETLRQAFDGFDPAVIIQYDDCKIEELLQNKGIIRNKLKVKAVVENAKAYYKVLNQYGSLHDFFWRYVNYEPIQNHWTEISQVPARTELSDMISKDLKKIGFKFVGSTIIYAFMQSIGMVNDHLTCCFLYDNNNKVNPS